MDGSAPQLLPTSLLLGLVMCPHYKLQTETVGENECALSAVTDHHGHANQNHQWR